MSDMAKEVLLRQFDTAWQLMELHLRRLDTEECLWRPAPRGPHVHRGEDGWRADWPEREDYDLGPPSIAWLTWHVVYWWSMVLDHSFGDAALSAEGVRWPGSAGAVCERLEALRREWRSAIEQASAEDLRSDERTRWPMKERPFAHVVAWVNIELMKNAAEIGYVRFLYAARAGFS
jgi:hypothetical protein